MAVIVTGCITRIADGIAFKRRAAASPTFAQLTPEQQARLEKGVVVRGDTRDMVIVACGKPDRVERTEEGEKWIYEANAAGGESKIDEGPPVYVPGRLVLMRAVSFRDGVVTGVVQRKRS